MKELLNKYPKEVLVQYMVSRMFIPDKSRLEYELASIHWEHESDASLAAMQSAAEERSRFEFLSPKWMAAEKRYQAACKRYDRTDRIYRRMCELRSKRSQP